MTYRIEKTREARQLLFYNDVPAGSITRERRRIDAWWARYIVDKVHVKDLGSHFEHHDAVLSIINEQRRRENEMDDGTGDGA